MENKEVRRQNLLILIDECHPSTKVAMSEKTGIPQQYISQIVNRSPGSNGKPRGMGNKTARTLEEKCGKPTGWMDTLHRPEDADKNELISIYDALKDPNLKQHLLEQARATYKLELQKTSEHPPSTSERTK